MSDGTPGDDDKTPVTGKPLQLQAVPRGPLDDVPSVRDRLQVALGSALITAVNLPTSRESAMVRTKLDEAIMWLGRVP